MRQQARIKKARVNLLKRDLNEVQIKEEQKEPEIVELAEHEDIVIDSCRATGNNFLHPKNFFSSEEEMKEKYRPP